MENEAKYTCPACKAKTCSLECVKRHKLRLECSGQVDPAKFVPNKELSSSHALVNRDYNYLLKFERKILLKKEDVKLSAKNIFKRKAGGPNSNKRQRPNPESADARIAQVNRVFPNIPQVSTVRENTLVIHVPAGMSRANQNKSGFDRKAGSFIWTVEWVPVDAEGHTLKNFISYRLKENTVLRDAVPLNVLQSAIPNQAIEKGSLHFYLANCISTSTKEHSIIALDAQATLSTALAGKVVLEYPKIFVATDKLIWSEYVQEEGDAYGTRESSDSESDSSDSSADSSSDSELESGSGSDSDDDERPEESSSKPPPEERPDVNNALAQLSYVSDQESEHDVLA